MGDEEDGEEGRDGVKRKEEEGEIGNVERMKKEG